jgi:SAM-dependent methyltransferase
VSGFDPDWLKLRESYDHAVRDANLTTAFVEALGPSPRLIDLGCGTGSNLRYLAPHLPTDQTWTCIDYDPLLLEVLQSEKPDGVDVSTLRFDLSKNLDDVPIEPGVGVTSTALLDLTSTAWLDQLAERCRNNPVLMTLAVDGVLEFQPDDPLDGPVGAAFWRHQATDKGFGPAAGPHAVEHLGGRFRAFGHEIRIAKSNWVFSNQDGAILDPLLRGIACAAMEIEPDLPVQTWLDRRIADVEKGRLTMTVGHEDLLALPQ